MSELQSDFFKVHKENPSIFILVCIIIGLEIVIPEVHKAPILKSISNPFEYGKILEEQRLKYLEKEPKNEEIISAIQIN